MKPLPLALATVESALNRLIVEQSLAIPSVLAGRCVRVDLVGPDTWLCFCFVGGHVSVSDSCQAADATVKGTPIALAAATLRGQAHTRDIALSGDLQVAQSFASLLGRLEPDWEEYLARYTGDTLAFQAGQTARALRRWGRQAAHALTEDTRDYLQFEARLLPSAAEVEGFNRAVDDLRAATERLEARARRLGR